MRADRKFFLLKKNKYKQVCRDEANLVSSALENGKHSPILDIDFEARLIPSSTPGRYHLYLDGLEMEWSKYRRLLGALAEAKVIEVGYARASLAHGATFLRVPGLKKNVFDDDMHTDGYDSELSVVVVNDKEAEAIRNCQLRISKMESHA